MQVELVVAIDEHSYGIGNKGKLLYRCKEDQQYFRRLTTETKNSERQNAILMGRKTYESIGKALPGRLNIVVSSTLNNIDNCTVVSSIAEGEKIAQDNNVETLYIIGGQSIYQEYIYKGNYDFIHLSVFKSDKCQEADTFFPTFIHSNHISTKIKTISKLNFELNIYSLELIKNQAEYAYLKLCRKVLIQGHQRQSRNAITRSLFSGHLSFDLRDGFPLLTTKRVWFKGVALELLWFLRGNTNAENLNKDKVYIWSGNTRRQYLDNIGLNQYQEGDAGPIYGFQWRHWNAEYKGCDKNYDGQGIDQLQMCINLINNNPNSRRILFSGWNPEQQMEMSLPPCHVLYQFYVNNGYLDCQMYQRSADLFLGVPFNIASVALLTTIISKFCGLLPGRINLCFGDIHIYESHVPVVEQQLTRSPYPFPEIEIKGEIPDLIEGFTYDQFKIINYHNYGTLKADMIA